MEYETTTVSISKRRLKAYISDTTAKRAKGLSGWKKLSKNECMLFIFRSPASYPMWMRGMKFPIDIVWLDEKKRVIDLKTDLEPAGLFDFKTYPNKGQAKYSIEFPAGFVRKNRVKANTTVKF